MLESENLVAWTAVAISGLAALLIVLWAGVAIRWRRVWGRRLGTLSESASRSDRLLAQLVAMLERTETETDVPGEQAGRAELEARRLRVLSRLGSTLDLDAVTHLALEYVIEEVGADGAVAVVREGERDPYVATFGLSTTESERELLGLSPDLNDARAVTLLYRYSPAEIENDAFPVTAGLAVPLEADAGRVGTLAVFWRRTVHEPADSEVARLRELSGLLLGPIESARRYE